MRCLWGPACAGTTATESVVARMERSDIQEKMGSESIFFSSVLLRKWGQSRFSSVLYSCTQISLSRKMDSDPISTPSVETRAPQFADAFVHEDAHLVRHQSGLRIDHLDRQRLGLELFQHVFELAALSVGRDHVRQKHAQTHAVDAGVDG